MFPYFVVFGKTVATYALMACVGGVAVLIMLYFLSKREKISIDDTILLALFVGGGIMIGGHLLYAITNVKDFNLLFKAKSAEDFSLVLKYLFGGSVFYGGLIGGSLLGLAGVRVLKLDLRMYADIMAISVPLFHGFARIGCFLGGCCYGIESCFGFTVYGNIFVPEINGVCRFPVQLLESACNFLIFGAIMCLFLKNKQRGRLFFIYLLLYSVVRFFDEYLRGDDIRGFVFGMSTSQFISIFLFTLAVCGLIIACKKERIVPKGRKESV